MSPGSSATLKQEEVAVKSSDEKSVQCDVTNDEKLLVMSIIKSDAELNTMCGLSGFQELDTLASELSGKLELRSMKLTQGIAMTFMGIVHDLKLDALSVFFKCDEETCKEVCDKVVKALVENKDQINWTPSDKILQSFNKAYNLLSLNETTNN